MFIRKGSFSSLSGKRSANFNDDDYNDTDIVCSKAICPSIF